MGIMAYFSLWVVQDVYHQPYVRVVVSSRRILPPVAHRVTVNMAGRFLDHPEEGANGNASSC